MYLVIPTSQYPQLHVLFLFVSTESIAAHMCMGIGISTAPWQLNRVNTPEEN